MGNAEKFISDCTRNCSNEYLGDSKSDGRGGTISKKKFTPWLTPDQARKAVEIAREEIIEKACYAYCKVCGHYAHTTPIHICRQACDYYKDFKNYITEGKV